MLSPAPRSPMKPKRRFAFTINIWDDVADNIIKHVASVDNFEYMTWRSNCSILPRAIVLASRHSHGSVLADPHHKARAEGNGDRPDWVTGTFRMAFTACSTLRPVLAVAAFLTYAVTIFWWHGVVNSQWNVELSGAMTVSMAYLYYGRPFGAVDDEIVKALGKWTNGAVVGTAEFNGKGTAGILWRDVDRTMVIWLVKGLSVLQIGTVGKAPANWAIAGTGDFNGDGMADILWRDSNGGGVAMWLMNGATIMSSLGVGNLPSNWVIAGVGDFNGDGMADILWRDSGGGVAMWLMNGATIISSLGVGNLPSDWQIVGTGDFNGDGYADIIWHTRAEAVVIWLMNGLSIHDTRALKRTIEVDAYLSDLANRKIPAGEATHIFPGTGAGYPIFATVSFYLFGPRTISLRLGFTVLLGLSILAFVLRFRDDRALAVPILFLALTFMLLTPQATDRVSIDQSPFGGHRFFVIAGIMPTLHVIFDLFDSAKDVRRRLGYILLGLQFILLLYVASVRVSAIYFTGAIVFAAVLSIWLRRQDSSSRRVLIQKAALLLIVGAASYVAATLLTPKSYHDAGLATETFWHRAFIGLGAHPDWPFGDLAAKYDCSPDVPEGKLFPGVDDANGHCVYFDAVKKGAKPAARYGDEYEKLLRKAFLAVVYQYPWKVLETYLLYNTKTRFARPTRSLMSIHAHL